MALEGRSGRSLDALLGEIARAPEVEPASSLVGTTLGRFRVEEVLGRGGMGVVYRARDTKLERDVALKLLRPDLVDDAERRARFLREGRLAASVSHACTAAIFDVGEEDGVVWVAMELVRGETLRAVLERGRLPIERVLSIAKDVARGLARAHELGIVHRDLKPENVMIDPGGHAKILDFGLAKGLDAAAGPPSTVSTELGRVLGTPSYMSPEQAKGRPVDARSDVFSFGVVLYEMLAARRPFTGETTVELLIAIDRDPPAPLGRDVPERMRALVERCLAKDASARPADGAALVEALGAGSLTERAGLRFAHLAGVGALVASVAGVAAVGARSTERPSSGPAVAAENIVLACPILQATGVDAPAGWLGAAAANIACRRARWILGGRSTSVLYPADLLELPRAVADEGVADPFSAPEARNRSVSAAKARATLWLDGAVERTENAFHVTFVLRARDGTERGRAEATDPRLDRAVAAAASAPAVALPAKPLDADAVRWLGITDTSLAVALEDWWSGSLLATPDDGPLRARAQELGAWWPFVHAATLDETNGEEDVVPAALDRSSDERFVRSVLGRGGAGGAIDDAVADEVRAIGLRLAPGTVGHALAASAEVRVRLAREPSRAYDVFAAAIADDPHWTMGWADSAWIATPTRSARAVARTMTYWTPEAARAWGVSSAPPNSRHSSPEMTRRGWLLAPESTGEAALHANALLRANLRDEPRVVAARLARAGAEGATEAEAILVAVEASYARLGAADRRGRALLASAPRFGRGSSAVTIFAVTILEAAILAGHGTELGDAFAERFVLVDPPRLDRGQMTAGDAPGFCAVASPPVAKRCVARLQQLIADGYFRSGLHFTAKAHVDALAAHLAGDERRAAALLHESFDRGRFERYPYVAEILDVAGDLEMAEKVDAISLPFAGYNGATLATVRAARRAAARRDIARARELATSVVEAWADADIPLPVVREMRELLSKLAPR